MPLLRSIHWLKHGGLWLYKLATFAVLAAGFGFAATVLGLRYYLLPQIDRYRVDIEAITSRAVGAPVTIASIDADWDGLRPHLRFTDLRIADRERQTGLLLGEVHATLAWRSVLLMQPVFHALAIDHPMLVLRRDRDGMLSVAGLPLDADKGFGDALLRHRQIIIRSATVIWQDEKLGAPELKLTGVDFRLDSNGTRHRFGLRAVPPVALASPLEVRGDLRGDRLSDLANWDGELYVELAYTDLALWRQWLPSPVLPSQGTGAVRAWVDVFDGAVEKATGDIRLADVLTRLDLHLPELALREVNGRVGWKRLANGFEASSHALAFATQDGRSPRPLDLSVKRTLPVGSDPGRLDLRANVLDLSVLTEIADRLPISDTFRGDLTAVDAQGLLQDLAISWAGTLEEPIGFRIVGRFDDLALRPGPHWPGFDGLNGKVDLSEKGGSATLKSRDVLLDAPTVFYVPLAFDMLDAQLAWTVGKNGVDVKSTSFAFANRDIAGNVSGTYQHQPGSSGLIDVTAALPRIDPQVIARYLPLVIGMEARQWIEQAFLGGRLADAKCRVKGSLAQFPWPGGKNGQFSVEARIDDVTFRFDESWPAIEGIKGALSFQGESFGVIANSAAVAGISLRKVRGVVRDLYQDPRLDLEGEASGATEQFLSAIEATPLGEMMGHVNRDVGASGSGKLEVKLDVPLRASRNTRVSGSYQFEGNRLLFSGDVPPIDQVTAKLDFTESGIWMQNGTAVAVGGPAVVNIGTEGGTVTVNASGRADVDAFRRQGADYFWLQYLKGAAAWRGSVVLRQTLADYVFDSDLQGLASTLPAPLAKGAEEALSTRFERRALGPDRDRLELKFGGAVALAVERQRRNGVLTPTRGIVAFGVPATLPESGVAIVGTARELDLGRWQAVFDDALFGADALPVSSVDFGVGSLQMMNRRFTDLRVTAALKNGVWDGSLSGPQLDGGFSYALKDNGKLTARLSRLSLRDRDYAGMEAEAKPSDSKEKPPDLDVVADSFHLGNKDLGRLELVADVQGQTWRIERLEIVNADATLKMTGQWRARLAQPSTDVSVDLDVADAGRLLRRLGYPEGIKGGQSNLTGKLAWRGRPEDLDVATLSGDLRLESKKGQFVKLEPGIAKLLGVISLQSLPRRITLDFGDIFSAGLSFDGISATITIANGIAATTDFLIRSPAATIALSGEVNLAAETQNLRVRVVPYLGEGVAIGATALGGPIAGVAALALQKILRDPIGQIMAFEYAVTGTWADPQVSNIGRMQGDSATPPG